MAVQRDQTARGSVRRRTAPAAATTSSFGLGPAGDALAPTRRPIAAVSPSTSPEGTSSPASGAREELRGPVADVVGHDRDPRGQRAQDGQGEGLPAAGPHREDGAVERGVVVAVGVTMRDPPGQPQLPSQREQGVALVALADQVEGQAGVGGHRRLGRTQHVVMSRGGLQRAERDDPACRRGCVGRWARAQGPDGGSRSAPRRAGSPGSACPARTGSAGPRPAPR